MSFVFKLNTITVIAISGIVIFYLIPKLIKSFRLVPDDLKNKNKELRDVEDKISELRLKSARSVAKKQSQVNSVETATKDLSTVKKLDSSE